MRSLMKIGRPCWLSDREAVRFGHLRRAGRFCHFGVTLPIQLWTKHAICQKCRSRSPAQSSSTAPRARRAGRRSVKRHDGSPKRGSAQVTNRFGFCRRWPFCTASRSLGLVGGAHLGVREVAQALQPGPLVLGTGSKRESSTRLLA